MTQTDELARLRAALHQAAPAPDPERRAAALRLSMESFDRHQASAHAVRSSKDRPRMAGFLAGVRRMFDQFTLRAGLGATASVAVLATGAFLVIRPVGFVPQGTDATGPLMEPVVVSGAPVADAASGKAAVQEATPAPAMAAPDAAQRRSAPMAVPLAPPQVPAVASDQGDRFADYDPNALRLVAEQPVSTFSVDVDTASWSFVRRSLQLGRLPPPAAVRLEEMVNYFPYGYSPPDAGAAPFRTSVAVFPTPWNPETRLVRIGLQGRELATETRPPLNLVFLVDTSGSMQGEDRLGLLKLAFRQLLSVLEPRDKVAIVAYAGSAGEVLPPTPASDTAAILDALDSLSAGGSTDGGAGLQLAYRLAGRMGGTGAVNRVILATDGDFNVGFDDPDSLAAFVAERRKSGVYLSVLGFGRGNLNDAVMQALAQNGNGTAAYIDTASEARKVLVDQAAGALFPIAGDVKVQVEWNPATIAEYRLLGYETRALNREDFANDRVDAGDIGAGHQVTALYEITPVDSAARLVPPLRYGDAPVGGPMDEAGWLRLRYKAPGEKVSALIEAPIPVAMTEADDDARFAAAIAGFAQLLAGGTYLNEWGWAEAIALADGARGQDPFGYRAEAVALMRIAKDLAE